MARTKFAKLHEEVRARPGAAGRMANARVETLDEIRLYELRHREAVSQATLAGRLEVTQGAVSKLEHSDDVRVSTLRQYLDALGAAWSTLRCSTTRTVGCRSISAAKAPPDRRLVSSALIGAGGYGHSGAVNGLSTRISPTPTNEDLREPIKRRRNRVLIRTNAVERRPKQTVTGNLITRRS